MRRFPPHLPNVVEVQIHFAKLEPQLSRYAEPIETVYRVLVLVDGDMRG